MTSKPRILIVDDDPSNRRLLSDLVIREGYVAITASGGAEALAVLSTDPIDLVLLDLMMPRVDGMAVLTELHKRQMLPALPVVVVTAHEDRSVRIDALTAGAIDFITKPIDRVEVTCRIRTLIELRQLRQRALAAVEDKLRESDRLLRLRFEQSPVAKVAWDMNFCVVAWNPAAERLFGYSTAQALGKRATFILPETAQAHVDSIWRDLLQGQTNVSTEENVTADGRTITCEWHNAPLTSADGSLLGVSSVILDLTERTRLESLLTQSQKMDAMGQLAGGIAHDFNNLLGVIFAYGGFARDALPEGDERRQDIVEVLTAADRAAGLTRQLLAFSRQQPTEKRPVDLNLSLAQVHKLLVRTLGEHVELTIIPAARPAVVRIDPVQFDQIALNLAVNARDAMPSGGRLRITLEHPPTLSDELGRPTRVLVKVTDTGTGMDEATQRRIFEPFFTTKEKGKGTGLGLATCFGIVADAGGKIHVDSKLGQGTTFTVELPLCNEAADSPVSGAMRVARTGHGETILVAEDDATLRKVAVRVLESAGYCVHMAADGNEAIRKLDELGLRLDLLLSDVVMPGCSGYDVAKHARRVSPGAAILLTSGFLGDESRRNQGRALPMLWKPLSPHDLIQAVGEALSTREVRDKPLAPVRTTPAPRQRNHPSRPPTPLASEVRKERVLVVEDDQHLVQTITRSLVDDYEVVAVGTLAAAGDVLEAGFDVVVLDLGLPDGSGLSLLQRLQGINSELPVVMMTGSLSNEAVTLVLRNRVAEYLPKPFTPEQLLATVRMAIEIGRVSRLRTKLLAARFGGDEFVKDLTRTEDNFALALPKVRMVFQPIVRAADGSVFGYEALLRCDEPSLSTPSRLLAAAELLGRVDEVGRIVRAKVATAMLEQEERLEAIFVNLHPTELRADLLAEVTDPLLALAGRVVLEITERASLEPGLKLDAELERIRQLGYRLAVDDLGEGYAGLSSLVYLRPDIAKIDISLVRDVHRMPLKRDIVAALVDMARRSGITVVAEGVESIDERDTLVDLGCDLLQGYLYAKPGSAFPFPHVRLERKQEARAGRAAP